MSHILYHFIIYKFSKTHFLIFYKIYLDVKCERENRSAYGHEMGYEYYSDVYLHSVDSVTRVSTLLQCPGPFILFIFIFLGLWRCLKHRMLVESGKIMIMVVGWWTSVRQSSNNTENVTTSGVLVSTWASNEDLQRFHNHEKASRIYLYQTK